MSTQPDDADRELKTLRAQAAEADVLIRFLRERCVVLNNEVRHRDGLLVQRDQQVVELTARVEALEAS